MAPILWFTTSGDTHHEEAFQSRSGDVYFSPFLLLSHHCYEFHVRPRLGVDRLLRRENIRAALGLRLEAQPSSRDRS